MYSGSQNVLCVAVFKGKPYGILKLAYFHNFTLTILYK